ncbi:unnamed protein product [Microthlaspi erraticum]|uniref:Uncharacterized protein n=1 Tax=Microthlaspi erraticum TaxID=1685480 RepID=A0A6D2JK29_9BRAS|nr:unnamed protein product [Microthlaspi erraticum]
MLTLLNLLIDLFTLFYVHPISNSPCFTLTTEGSFLFWFSFLPSPSQPLPHVLLGLCLSILLAPLIISLLVNAGLLPSPLNILDCPEMHQNYKELEL